MRFRSGAAVAIAACALVALAACGSSYQGLSKADFITQADAICKKYDDLSRSATSGLKQPTDAQLTQVIQTKIVPLLPKQEAELRALKPPKADRAAVKQFLDTLQLASDDLARNTAVIVQTKGVSAYGTQAAGQASAYGFKVCGTGGG